MPRTKQIHPRNLRDKIEEAQKELNGAEVSKKEILEAGIKGGSESLKGVKRKKIVAENHLKKIPKSPLRNPLQTKHKQNTGESAAFSVVQDTSDAHKKHSCAPAKTGKQCTKQNGEIPGMTAEASKSEDSVSPKKASFPHHRSELRRWRSEGSDPARISGPDGQQDSSSSPSKTRTDNSECSSPSCSTTPLSYTSTAFDVLLKAMEPELSTLSQKASSCAIKTEKLRPNKTVWPPCKLKSSSPDVSNPASQELVVESQCSPRTSYPVHEASAQKNEQAAAQPVSHLYTPHDNLVPKPSQQNQQLPERLGLTGSLTNLHTHENTKLEPIYNIAMPSTVGLMPPSSRTQVTPPHQQMDSASPASVSPASSTQSPPGPIYSSTHVASVVSQSVEQMCNLLLRDQKPKKQGKYICEYCNRACAKPSVLLKHIRSHTGERPYRCSACPKGFRDSTGLLHHQVVHTGEKPYCCLVCELRFSSRSSLGRHLKRQHRGVLPSPLQPSPGLPPLNSPCSVCCNVGPCTVCGGGGAGGGEGLEGAGATSWGLAEAAAAAAASLPPFACGACARRFDHGRELAAHWAAHTDVKPFKCPRCERDFNAPALLERHKLTHDLQGSNAPPTQVWSSGGGPEVAGDGDAVEVRDAPPTWDAGLLLSPTGAGIPKLEALLPEGEGAENARAPAAAAEASSEDTLYQCDCGTFFASAPALASHLEAHSGPATYGCGHCGALYAALAALEEHRRASHGEGSGEVAPDGEGEQATGGPGPGSSSRGKKIFGCSECEKLFRSPRDLERHVLVHTGEKPFPCLECGKFFRHECYLKRHRLLHGTERPFPCHICGKGFITLSNLSRHLKLHRGMD